MEPALQHSPRLAIIGGVLESEVVEVGVLESEVVEVGVLESEVVEVGVHLTLGPQVTQDKLVRRSSRVVGWLGGNPPRHLSSPCLLRHFYNKQFLELPRRKRGRKVRGEVARHLACAHVPQNGR